MAMIGQADTVAAVRIDPSDSILVEQAPATLPAVPTRAQIEALEGHMRREAQIDIPTRHYFAHGIYAREITIPAGVLLTGKVHRTEHLNILSAGEITVWTEDGMKRLRAPATIVSRPGTKRVGYAHTECVWTTIHGTHERDLDRLEAELIEAPAIAAPDALAALAAPTDTAGGEA